MTVGATREKVPSRSNFWIIVVACGIAVIALGMVVAIADSVREADRIVRTDERIMRLFVDHRTAWLTTVAKIVTQLAGGLIVTPIVIATVALLLRVRHRRAALVVALGSIGTVALVQTTKHFIGRARPPIADRLVSAQGLSFPSGHSAQSVACYGALAWLVWELGWRRRARVLSVVAAALVVVGVGLSRVYLGVHWPSDVLSGWLLGLGWLAALVGVFHLVAGRPATLDRHSCEERED
jgi:undecaprenyl-diphosphatase